MCVCVCVCVCVFSDLGKREWEGDREGAVKREMRTLDITVSVTGAREGKLNKRQKEAKVQNREGRWKETEDESDKSVGEKDVKSL